MKIRLTAEPAERLTDICALDFPVIAKRINAQLPSSFNNFMEYSEDFL
jgi:hypothetical protein